MHDYAVPMIKQLESTLRDGAAPKAPQFIPQTEPLASRVDQSKEVGNQDAGTKAKAEGSVNNAVPASNGAQHQASADIVDPLGDARNKIQGEITREFTAIMATGTLRASEAAALATKRVMERYGHTTTAQS